MQLYYAVAGGNIAAVRAAHKAGAGLNGHPEQPYAPIVVATFAGHGSIVKWLLEQGADPDKPVTLAVQLPGLVLGKPIHGARALHIAARGEKVQIVRLLLERSRADPNATDNGGRTPLMAICSALYPCVRVEVVRLLLEAGADPTLAGRNGFIPLHMAALYGRIDLVDMRYSKAPATLNRCASNGMTPLFMACSKGHESIVSKLLFFGAMQPVYSHESVVCPIAVTIEKRFVGVVRVLINEGGISAVGGGAALRKALYLAVRDCGPIILKLLLAADGEEGRLEWANTPFMGKNLLHYGASFCNSAAVGILLEAGADAAARDAWGRTPRDAIGVSPVGESQIDQGKEVAIISRMLQRGPAYRARSWVWPSGEQGDACGSGHCDTAADAGDGAASAVVLSPPAVKPPPVVGVRIFRPKEKGGSKFFVRLIGRYCAKD